MDREEKAAEVPAPAAGGQEKKPGRKRKKEESQDLPLSELPVTELKGVGPQQQARLAKLGSVTVQDLLFHLPVSYEGRTRLDRLSPDIFFGEERVFLNLAGKFITGRMTYGRKMLYRGEVKCDGGILNIVIFNARPFQVRIIESAGALLLYGEVKPGSGGGYEMIQPEIQSFPSRESITLSGSLTPNYPLTEGINQRFMRKIAGEALDLLKERGIEELIPEDAMKNPVSLADALRTLHAPPPGVTDEMVRSGSMPAQRRLIAEELAAHHISILEERARNKALRAPAFRGKSELEEKFLASLPFTPTRAQERVSGEIAADLYQQDARLPSLRRPSPSPSSTRRPSAAGSHRSASGSRSSLEASPRRKGGALSRISFSGGPTSPSALMRSSRMTSCSKSSASSSLTSSTASAWRRGLPCSERARLTLFIPTSSS